MPFDKQSAVLNASKAHASRERNGFIIGQHSPLSQAVQLQRALHKVGMAVAHDLSNGLDDATRARAESSARIGASLASIAKGWDSLAARVQILRGKAAPGTLSPAERRAKAESKRPKAQQSGPRAARPAADSPAQNDPSRESLS